MTELNIDLDGLDDVNIAEFEIFQPIEAGTYVFRILEIDQTTHRENTNNAGRGMMKFVLQGPDGGSRRLRDWVGLYLKFNPTAKNPDGYPNRTFYQFFGALEGLTATAFENHLKKLKAEGKTWTPPSPSDLIAKEIGVRVKVVHDEFAYERALDEDPDAKPEHYKRNEVSSYLPAAVVRKNQENSGSSGSSLEGAVSLEDL